MTAPQSAAIVAALSKLAAVEGVQNEEEVLSL
jgi:hypothetical protein